MPRQPITFQRVAEELLLPRLRLNEEYRNELEHALRSRDEAELERATLAALADLASRGELPVDSRGLPPGQLRYYLPDGTTLVVLSPSAVPAFGAAPRRYPMGVQWGEPPPPEALQELIRLHEELLTQDRSSLRSPIELIRTLVEQARRILGADQVRWIQGTETPVETDWDSSFMARPSDNRATEEVLRDGTLLVWDNLEALKASGRPAPGEREGMRSLAVVRVGQPPEPGSGVLEVWSRHPGFFRHAHLSLLEVVAEEVGLLLRQLLQIQRFVFLDALTGLYNRSYYEMQFRRELARAERDREPMALLLCDVDNFKRFNTDYGYAGGDTVLRGVAECLQKGVRPFDSVARYGGEEFVVLLTAPVDREDARTIAERLRHAVGQAGYEVTGLRDRIRRNVSVTVSMGVALYPEDAQGESELWRKANEAVLVAKASGKNQVCFWSDTHPSPS